MQIFLRENLEIACLRRHKHAHKQLATACQQNDMPYFELRWVYLSPAVTHYQEGVQLCKVLHIIQPMKEEYIDGRQQSHVSSFSMSR